MADTPATIAAYFAATRSMDREAWVACFASDAESHDPVGAPPHRGHAALRTFFDSILALVTTVGLHEDSVHACGNRVAVKWTMRGVGKNGRSFTCEGVDVFALDVHGKIAKLDAYWDAAALVALLTGP